MRPVTDRHACPCCGYRTLLERDRYELCPVCFWEDDPSESRKPGFALGANGVSLVEAQQMYLRLGATHPSLVNKVRPPQPEEARPADWRPHEASNFNVEPVITRDEAGELLGIASWRITYRIVQGDLVKGIGPDPLAGYVTQSSVRDELIWQANAGPLKRAGRLLSHLFQWF